MNPKENTVTAIRVSHLPVLHAVAGRCNLSNVDLLSYVISMVAVFSPSELEDFICMGMILSSLVELNPSIFDVSETGNIFSLGDLLTQIRKGS